MIQRIPYYIVCYYLSPDPNCSPLWLEAVLQPIAPMTQGEALIHVARPSLRLSFPAFPKNPSWTLSRGLCGCLPLTQQRYPKTIVEGKCSRARLEMRQGTFVESLALCLKISCIMRNTTKHQCFPIWLHSVDVQRTVRFKPLQQQILYFPAGICIKVAPAVRRKGTADLSTDAQLVLCPSIFS